MESVYNLLDKGANLKGNINHKDMGDPNAAKT